MIFTDDEVRAAYGALVERMRSEGRKGRPLIQIAAYLADLTEPLGHELSRAIHAAKLGPDPDSFFGPACRLSSPPGAPFIVGAMTVEALQGIAQGAGKSFAGAAVALRRTPPADHVRVLVAAEERPRVVYLPSISLWPS